MIQTTEFKKGEPPSIGPGMNETAAHEGKKSRPAVLQHFKKEMRDDIVLILASSQRGQRQPL